MSDSGRVIGDFRTAAEMRLALEAKTAEVESLRAENSRLREALRPIAEYGEARDAVRREQMPAYQPYPDSYSVVEYGSVSWGSRGYAITIGDCRRAKEVLGDN